MVPGVGKAVLGEGTGAGMVVGGFVVATLVAGRVSVVLNVEVLLVAVVVVVVVLVVLAQRRLSSRLPSSQSMLLQ